MILSKRTAKKTTIFVHFDFELNTEARPERFNGIVAAEHKDSCYVIIGSVANGVTGGRGVFIFEL